MIKISLGFEKENPKYKEILKLLVLNNIHKSFSLITF